MGLARVLPIVLAAVVLLFAIYPAACHKEEQAVVGVAQTAEKAEQKAQATATVQDNEHAQLALIPLPTKSMYVDVHEPAAWANPYISVGPEMLSMQDYVRGREPQHGG